MFQNDADRLYATTPSDNLAKKVLIFDANPHLERIVFVCVPHRGSYLASNWVGSIGVGLIRLPSVAELKRILRLHLVILIRSG